MKDDVNFKHWGTFITTPFVSKEMAQENIKTEANGKNVKLVTEIKDVEGKVIATESTDKIFGTRMEQNIGVPHPKTKDKTLQHRYRLMWMDVKYEPGTLKVVCNGDATSLELFHLPTMKAFSGKLVVTVQSLEEPGEIELRVNGKGLKSEKIKIQTTIM